MYDKINEFVDTMIAEKGKFAQIQKEIATTQQQIEDTVRGFKVNQESLLQSLKDGKLAQEDALVKEILQNTTATLSEKIEAVEQDIQEGLKGMTFIEEFEKKFTVSVFGKVKAGKSYLGNFVMGQTFKSHKIPSSYDKIEEILVTVYDKGVLSENTRLSTMEKDDSGFVVNMNEATSTIQYFDIGGITWFDTPGIGSMTPENEELAKEYVKNSDLVVYASSSDAAGTRQDFEEMKELFHMDKPILLLLTQSDDNDFDINEDGEEITIYKAKSEKDRRDAEEYMIDTMKKNGISDILKLADVLSVSAFLANEGIKTGGEDLFRQSNMGIFLDKLIEITKNDAADMKRKNPTNRMNKMISDIVNHLEAVIEELHKYFQELEKTSEDLKYKEEFIVQDVKAKINQMIKQKLSELTQRVEVDKTEISSEQLQEIVRSTVHDCITKACANELSSQMEKVSGLEIPVQSMGELKMQQGTVTQTRKERYRERRNPNFGIEWIGETFFDKTYYRTVTKTSTEEVSFDIGINEVEIRQNIMAQIDTTIAEIIESMFGSIFANYYTPVKELEQHISNEIKKTITTLEELKS